MNNNVAKKRNQRRNKFHCVLNLTVSSTNANFLLLLAILLYYNSIAEVSKYLWNEKLNSAELTRTSVVTHNTREELRSRV